MLDQNTDRMWFVIGAVIVGAAIIFIANGTLPTLFASVTDSFEGATGEAVAVIEALDQPVNLFSPATASKGFQLNVRGDTVHGILGELKGDGWDATSESMPVRSNTSYVFYTTQATVVKRVAFYDKNNSYIDGWKQSGGSYITVTSPSNAVYARISTDYNPLSTAHSPLDTWWFGTAQHYSILEEGD